MAFAENQISGGRWLRPPALGRRRRGAALLCATIAAVAAAACVLVVDDKTACEHSSDCVRDRICVDGTCSDDACDHLCERSCEALVECNIGDLAPCAEACGANRPAFLADVPRTEAVCKQRWDRDDEALDCDAVRCELYCDKLCSLAQACGDIDDAAVCRAGCAARPPGPCDPGAALGLTCGTLGPNARCSEARGLHGADFDCRHAPCDDDYDCAPTETCASEACYPRCSGDEDCPGGSCILDHCTDPVGTPCSPEASEPCGWSSACINVDADNRTTGYYCSRDCYSDEPCPAGFVCIDSECRG